MYLQLYFADPAAISRSQSPDQLVVDVDPFQDLLMGEYVLEYPIMLDASLSYSYMNIPMQSVATAGMQLTLMRSSVFIKSASTTLMVSNLVANFLMTSSLQMLWGMINTMQLMVILTLFNVPHPESVIQMTKMIT